MLGGFLWMAAVLVALVLCAVALKRKREAFDQRFPPISEAEYLALCAPGTDPQVALAVRRILSEALCVDYQRIYPSSRLIEDLGAE